MFSKSLPAFLIPYLTGEKKDYSSVRGTVITINAVCVTLICLTTGLRFWVRFGMLRSAGADDMIMIVAVIFALLLSASGFLDVRFGLGLHIWNITPGDLAELQGAVGRIVKIGFATYLFYSTAIAFTKFSIMATYFRIFVPKGKLRKVVLGTAVIVLCLWISSLFAILFTCIPLAAAWDYTVEGQCYPIVKYFYVSSTLNMVTDLLLCFLPLPTLWALKMPVAQRVVLCGLFCGGVFACIASIFRLTQLHNIENPDVTYESVSSFYWTVIEVDTAIVCTSLGTLRPLASRMLPNFFQHFSQPTNNTSPPVLTSSMLGSSRTSVSRNRISKSQSLQSPSTLSRPSTHTTSRSNFSTFKKGKDKNGGFGDDKGESWPTNKSDGEIMVERTFDVTELTELPPAPRAVLPTSPIAVPRRFSSRGNFGKYNDMARLFDRSSEEDLNEPDYPTKSSKM